MKLTLLAWIQEQKTPFRTP